MGAVTASSDCSLVAVLCRTNNTHNAANFGGTDFVRANGVKAVVGWIPTAPTTCGFTSGPTEW